MRVVSRILRLLCYLVKMVQGRLLLLRFWRGLIRSSKMRYCLVSDFNFLILNLAFLFNVNNDGFLEVDILPR